VPTRGLFLLLLVPALLGAFGGLAALVAVLLLALVVVAAFVDYGLTRRVPAVRVLQSDKLSLGVWNPVRLEVYNTSARAQRLHLRDVVPTTFELDPATPLFEAFVDPGQSTSITYGVRPRERGDAQFGDLYLRAEGPLRLVRRSFRLPDTACAVKIYPGLRDLKRYDLLVRRGLEAQPGRRAVRVPGASTEFERVREYVPDDEYRRVNWKATARRGQPMVNQFESERSQNLVVLLDSGRAMAALAEAPASSEDDAPPGLRKLDFALNAALLLSYVASLRGDRVALLAYADDVRTFVPPQRGRRALLNTVQALYNLQAEPVEPDHGRALDFLARRNLRRSLVVLFTDLADRESSETLAAHLVRAARHHLVVCVTLADPNVRRPAAQRPLTGHALYEKVVAQQLLDDRAQVLATLTAYGVLTVDTDADKLNPRLINTYLELKQRGRI
jgi:uncharacterized protein (DUF58 family)